MVFALASPLTDSFFGENWFPTKKDYGKKGTLILTSTGGPSWA